MEKKDWKTEFLQIIKILKDSGVDVNAISLTKKGIEKKSEWTQLKDIKQDGVDIEFIIRDKQLDENYEIGKKLNTFRNIYKGTIKGRMSDEERTLAEELGVVEKVPTDRQPPLFKGRKISQFHVDFINKHLNDILSGKLNTREVLELLKRACISQKETIIEDVGSIKRIVEIILKDRPEEVERYKQSVKKNSGRRNSQRGKIGKTEPGEYYSKEEKLKQRIIEEYLPLILAGDITTRKMKDELQMASATINKIIEEHYLQNNDLNGLEQFRTAKKRNLNLFEARDDIDTQTIIDIYVPLILSGDKSIEMISEELHISHKTFNKIVENYYLEIEDLDALEAFRNAKIRNRGPSEDIRKKAKEMRGEVSTQGKLLKSEFLALPEEEQDRQLIIKYRQYRLDQEKKTGKKNQVLTEETTKRMINKTKEYFRKKQYFTELDIRHMIFIYPSIVGRDEETLDEKIELLLSYDEFEEEDVYGMIKTFPAIMGYDVSRTKRQLNLLQSENLMDYVISRPDGLMRSVNLMYALIQYAKERHNTSDLSDINRSNIFMTNSVAKRAYRTNYEELKKRYPYYEAAIDEEDVEYIVTGQDIGKATYREVSVTQAEEASKVVEEILKTRDTKEVE